MMKMKKLALATSGALIAVGALGVVGYAAMADDGATQPSASVASPAADQMANLPDRVPVSGPDGNWAGYADKAAITAVPNYAAYPDQPEAASDAWLHERVPVTKTEDPNSELVGHVIRGYGFVDLATENAPGFSVDALVQQGRAREAEEQKQYAQENRQATSPTP
jgi:hypothetical protein